MKSLTAKEEEIMHILWVLEHGFVKEIIAHMKDPKPHYNTVSTTIRILVDKGVVGYESFGTSHRYFPILQKADYKRNSLRLMATKYFDNSYKDMVAFFAKEEKLSPQDLQEIIDEMKKS